MSNSENILNNVLEDLVWSVSVDDTEADEMYLGFSDEKKQ